MWQIKPEYQQRIQVEPYTQKELDRIHQPHVYAFAHYLCERLEAKYVIDIGCGNGVKLKGFPAGTIKFGIDYGPNLELFRKNNPNAEILSIDLEADLPELPPEVIENSVVLCADVLEHLHNPEPLLKYLSKLSYQAMFLLVSTPDRVRQRGVGDFGPSPNPWHLREWSSDELNVLFQEYAFKPGFWGYSTNNNELLEKTTSLYIGGRLNGFETTGKAGLTAVAVMSVFNEKDIALQNVQHYLAQGLHVHVIDNWSDNGIYERIQKFAESHPQVTTERFPATGSENRHMWKEMLDRKAAYASQSGFDWALHVDADEFRFSPWKNVSLLEGIQIVDALGFNTIDFTMFEFRPVRQGFNQNEDPKKFFHHFEFAKGPGAFLHINGWKIQPGVTADLSAQGGHHIQFEGQKVYPLKFEDHHFAYRSLEQIEEKLYKDRLPRIEEGITKRGWHVHLIDFALNHGVRLWKVDGLLTDSSLTRETYLVERLSGVGLPIGRIDTERSQKMYAAYKEGKFRSFDGVSVESPEASAGANLELQRVQEELEAIKNTRSWKFIERLIPLRSMFVSIEGKIKGWFRRK